MFNIYTLSFSFEKGSNGQNHSLSDSHHLIIKSPPVKCPIPSTGESLPNPLTLFGKPCSSSVLLVDLKPVFSRQDLASKTCSKLAKKV